MILVDANLLLYAKIADYPQHDAVRAWLTARLNDIPPVGMPWPCLLAFHRIATSARLFERPMSPADSWAQIEAWLALPGVWCPAPTDRHREALGALIRSASVQGNLTYDAHLAALALEHGLILYSSDGDFARFEGLRWKNPIGA